MLTVLGALALAVGALAVAAHYVFLPTRVGSVLAAVSPYGMLTAPLGVVLLLLARSWGPAALAVAVTAAAAWSQAPLWTTSRPDGSGPRLTVLQANLLLGGADAGAVVAHVRAARADVVTIEELTAEELDRLHDVGLDDLLPYRFVRPHPGGGGTGLWSRYPLAQRTPHGGFRLEVLSAVVQPPGAVPVTVFAVHLLPGYPYPSGTWNAELTRLGGLLRAADGTVLAGGDLNATRDHVQFRRLLRGGVTDAADQVGRGRLPTWPTDRRPVPPLFALDHVLLRGAQAESIRTVPLPGSDHRGVVVTVRLPPPGR